MKSVKLSLKRRRFVEEYLVDCNATQAAVRAGYSPRSANAQGSRLLANDSIAAAIKKGRRELSELTRVTAEKVVFELARVAFFDPRRLYREDGTLKDPSEWDEDTAAAVATLDVITTFKGNHDHPKILKKLKLWDKPRALEMLGRHLALFTDNVNHGATDDLAGKLARAEERIRKRGRKKDV